MRMRYCGICPATGGELLQGAVDEGREYLASYCIDLYSKAYFVKRKTEEEAECRRHKFFTRSKSLLMKNLILERFGIKEPERQNYVVYLDSQIPTSKGFASSTADLGATAAACLAFLGEKMKVEEISELAAGIEATDSSFYPDTVIFDPLRGRKIETLGFLGETSIIVLEPAHTVSTEALRRKKEYMEKKTENMEEIRELFSSLKSAFAENCEKRIGEIATRSAFLNQNLLHKPKLNEIRDITEHFGGYGINVAHSGTAVFLLCPKEMEKQPLLDRLKEEGIRSIYPFCYTVSVIKGGLLKEENLWIM